MKPFQVKDRVWAFGDDLEAFRGQIMEIQEDIEGKHMYLLHGIKDKEKVADLPASRLFRTYKELEAGLEKHMVDYVSNITPEQQAELIKNALEFLK